ncbi:MAG: 5-deoxy-glucuronate isomerase [Armatimonadetes bacterium]|nr:5-deoxy-glucuronate isomerase [Armatimonadota bacterium]
MKLHYKGNPLQEGYNLIVSPENAPLKYLEVGRLLLAGPGKRFLGETGGRELVLELFAGTCSISVTARIAAVYEHIGGRPDAFTGKPTAVYVPRDSRFEITSESTRLDIGMAYADTDYAGDPALVRPDDVMWVSAGQSNWRRDVYTTIGPQVKAGRLILGETINPPGHWSSYPPHKHDTFQPPSEAPYEEVYSFQVKPAGGFGIQRVYTPKDDPEPLDATYVVEDGDTVVLPRGYHPVVAAAGYRVLYFWILAGEGRQYGAWSDDPAHAWLKNTEPMIKEMTL